MPDWVEQWKKGDKFTTSSHVDWLEVVLAHALTSSPGLPLVAPQAVHCCCLGVRVGGQASAA